MLSLRDSAPEMPNIWQVVLTGRKVARMISTDSISNIFTLWEVWPEYKNRYTIDNGGITFWDENGDWFCVEHDEAWTNLATLQWLWYSELQGVEGLRLFSSGLVDRIIVDEK
jgi:hypothetical protein